MGLMNLKSLNESLDKIYAVEESSQLNEAVQLNEKFSDSMPDWLAKRLLTTKLTRHRSAHKSEHDFTGYKDPDAKNPRFGAISGYSNPRGDEKYEQQSLWNKFKKVGIPLDRAEFEEGPVPTSGADPRLKDPDVIPIFLLTGNQVYAMGLNDEENYNGPDWNELRYTNFKRISTKFLLDHTIKFATVHKDLENTTTAERTARGILASEMPADLKRGKPGERRYDYESSGYITRDKSGYFVVPTSSKYRKELEKAKIKYIPEQLDNLETDIKGTWNRVTKSLTVSEIENINPSNIRTVISYMQDARNSYIRALEQLDDARRVSDPGSKEYLDYLNRSDILYYLKESKKALKEAKDYFGRNMVDEIDF